LVSAFLITGTIRLPLGRAAAIPIFMSFLIIILLPSTLALIIGNLRMQFTIASMNIGVNVIFSLYFFWNSPFTLLRQFTILVTSASVKLVTWADVALLRTIWSAISLRIRSISTIST